MTRLLTEDDVAVLLDHRTAFTSAEEAFQLLGMGTAHNGPRQRLARGGATVNIMAAIAPTLGAMGVKTYPVVRTDVSQGSAFTFQLFDLSSGQLRALLRADTLGQRRTAAATALATRLLARRNSTTLAVFGAGWQARGQVDATVRALPGLTRVLAVGRSPRRLADFCAELTTHTGVPVIPSDPETAVRSADVLITATGSRHPVFDGAWLCPGTHINAVGSNYADKRELDETAVARADMVVADSVEVAREECGDLLGAQYDWSNVREFGDVVAGRTVGRSDDADITLFESQGLSLLDLTAAVRVVSLAEERDVGTRVDAW